MRKTWVKIKLLLLLPAFGMAQRHVADSLQTALHKAPNDSVRYQLNMQIGYLFQEVERDSAIHYYDVALLIAQKHRQPFAEAGAVGIKGYQLALLGRYAESLQCFQDAFSLVDENPNDGNGWVFSPSGSHPRDIKVYTLSRLQLLYGILMHATGNISQQIFYLKESIKNGKLANDAYRIAQPEMNLGIEYVMLHKPDSTLLTEQQGLKELQSSADKKYEGLALAWIGIAYLQKGNMPQAKKYLYESLHWARTDNLSDVDQSWFGITNYYLAKANKDSSLISAKKTLQIMSLMPTGDRDFNIDGVYDNLARSYRLNNQPDSVIKYQAEALRAKDSIYHYRIKNLAAFQNLGFRQQLHLRDLEKQRLAYQSRVRIYAMLTGIAVLMLLAGIFYRNNRQKQKANILLNQQKEEIQNALSQLKATQTQLIQSEKMASLGELTAGIAHEIQNPLNFVNNFSDVNREMIDELAQELKSGNIDEAIAIAADLRNNEEKINHHGKRADGIVKGMLEHSRASTGQKEPTDLNKLADEYLRLAYHGLSAKDKDFNAELITHFDENLPSVNAIPQDIGRVLLNLFNNAFYTVNQKSKTAGPDYKPTVEVATSTTDGHMLITVRDNGNGIPENIKDKIMQPFFTTKPTGEGTGLGLSLSYDIVVKGHGGKIDVESALNEGTTFTISLPL